MRVRMAPALMAVAAAAGCITAPRLDGPPAASLSASPIGFDASIRAGALDRRYFEDNLERQFAGARRAATDRRIDIIALSGGGAAGAFGAGVLVGMTQHGDRPQFEMVTGVSTGALIAPFAFLGPDWDPLLKEAFTGEASERLLRFRGVGALFSPAIYQGRPLYELVERFVTDDMIAAVAAERAKGRLLFVATTNLDREETVIWDMGAIAAEGGTRARNLFIKVLVASASVPGVFPPVMIEVEDHNQPFQEMHVDGGASTPFFVAPDVAFLTGYEPDHLRGGHVYVVINGQITSPPRSTPVNTVSIASRSFNSVLAHMSRTALVQTDIITRRAGMTFQFTLVPHDYPFGGPLDFEPASMHALFEFGRRCAAEGKIWVTPREALTRGEQAEANPTPEACPAPAVEATGEAATDEATPQPSPAP